jgi:succinate dehydrogenase/fumarate reductase cytochrome b subunit
MNMQRVAGMILLVVGIVLFIVGLNASDSLADQWSNFFTGQFTDATMWYIIGGIVMAVVGLMLVVFGGRIART